jgi:hypothetical protein
MSNTKFAVMNKLAEHPQYPRIQKDFMVRSLVAVAVVLLFCIAITLIVFSLTT